MGFNSFQDFDDSRYGLRENPKKTWRVSVLDTDDKEYRGMKRDREMNMRDHSGKTLSGFEVLCPVKKKRSNLRYRVSGFCSVSDFNSVSKFSEFSGEEEAALSLVMLSSGFTKWDGFVSDFDSSENDPLISKAKALNGKKFNLELESKDGLGSAQVEIEFGETRFHDQDTDLGVKLNSFDSEFGDFVPSNAFEKFSKGDGLEINFSDTEIGKANEFETSKETKGSGDHDSELGVKLTSCDSEFGDFVVNNAFEEPLKGNNSEIDFLDSTAGNKFGTSEETSFNDQNIDLGTNGFVAMEIDDFVSKISENCESKTEIKCKTCNKKFPSFQALGGHRAKRCHEESVEMEISYEQKKKKGIHECPICSKVFPSGQALGGHKRAHFNGFFENKNKESAAGVAGFSFVKQFGFGLRPCGAKSGCGPEPVVISN